MNVKFQKLNPDAVTPTYANPGDAGLDLTAISYEYKNDRHVYGTGLAFEIPDGYVGLVFARSSIFKYNLRLSNAVGVIDSGYRGEIKFFFENDGMIARPQIIWDGTQNVAYVGNDTSKYQIGDRIGQLVIMPYPSIELEEADQLDASTRGNGGFGSSGT